MASSAGCLPRLASRWQTWWGKAQLGAEFTDDGRISESELEVHNESAPPAISRPAAENRARLEDTVIGATLSPADNQEGQHTEYFYDLDNRRSPLAGPSRISPETRLELNKQQLAGWAAENGVDFDGA